MAKRRLAANRVVFSDGHEIVQAYIVLDEGRVMDVLPFTAEQPRTEWIEGTIEIKQDTGLLHAWHKGKQLL